MSENKLSTNEQAQTADAPVKASYTEYKVFPQRGIGWFGRGGKADRPADWRL